MQQGNLLGGGGGKLLSWQELGKGLGMLILNANFQLATLPLLLTAG